MFHLFIRCFTKKYFQFKGRANRREYLSFLIFDFSIVFLLMILIKITLSNIFIIVLTIYGLVSFFPSISVIVRRLHDFNISWWSYFFFYCVSMIIIIYLMIQDGSIRRGVEMSTTTSIFSWLISIFQWLVLLCIKGTSGSNHYGKPPIN
ncbi:MULTISPECIES: DUF805 domain-containing protein [unclassified Rickettsia]|uniref:DUF805 domain-containing protein n=1 Tax=unclassified Rickettsia TaxID=114295 RepID=UPI003132C7C9